MRSFWNYRTFLGGLVSYSGILMTNHFTHFSSVHIYLPSAEVEVYHWFWLTTCGDFEAALKSLKSSTACWNSIKEGTSNLKPKWWSVLSVAFTPVHIYSLSWPILLNHPKKIIWSASPGTDDVSSDRIHTLPALWHKGAEQQYYDIHWVPTPQ